MISRPRTFALLAALVLLPAAALADDDADFVKKAATGGMMEVELGRVAVQNAASPAVREFGQMMVTDHTKANSELSTAARKQGLSVPTELTQDQRDAVAKLSALKGEKFDQAYIDAMVDDHEKDADALRAQAAKPESDVDRWAAKTLPVVENHLMHARSMQKEVEGGPAARRDEDMPSAVGSTEPARP